MNTTPLTLNKQKYTLKILSTEAEASEALQLVASEYVKKLPSLVGRGLKAQDYYSSFEYLIEHLVKQGLSAIIIENSTGRIVAASLVLDLFTDLPHMVDKIDVRIRRDYKLLLDYKNRFVEDGTFSGEKGVYGAGVEMVVRSDHIREGLAYEVLYASERLLYNNGFKYGYAEGVSKAAINLLIHKLKYTPLKMIKLNEYEYKGKRPYKELGDDAKVALVIKDLRKKALMSKL